MTQTPPDNDSTNAEQPPPASLLFVDDEVNILKALKRLFRPQGYKIHTAGSGAAGLVTRQGKPSQRGSH